MLISAALGLFVAKPRYEVMIDKKGQLSEKYRFRSLTPFDFILRNRPL